MEGRSLGVTVMGNVAFSHVSIIPNVFICECYYQFTECLISLALLTVTGARKACVGGVGLLVCMSGRVCLCVFV